MKYVGKKEKHSQSWVSKLFMFGGRKCQDNLNTEDFQVVYILLFWNQIAFWWEEVKWSFLPPNQLDIQSISN